MYGFVAGSIPRNSLRRRFFGACATLFLPALRSLPMANLLAPVHSSLPRCRGQRGALLELPAVREARDADLPRRPDDAEVERLLVIVVVPVGAVGRRDVDVVRAGQERERVHREAHDTL